MNLEADRLARIETKLDTIITVLKRYDGVLYGNGKPGLILDTDRLMTAYKFWRWVAGIALGAISTGMVELIVKTW